MKKVDIFCGIVLESFQKYEVTPEMKKKMKKIIVPMLILLVICVLASSILAFNAGKQYVIDNQTIVGCCQYGEYAAQIDDDENYYYSKPCPNCISRKTWQAVAVQI